MKVARPTLRKNRGAVDLGSVDIAAAEPNTPAPQQRHPEAPAQSLALLLPNAETYRRRAEEAKSLAKQCQDVWEREILLRVATQWQLLAAHRDVKESRQQRATGNVRRP